MNLKKNKTILRLYSIATIFPSYLYDIQRFVRFSTLGGYPSTAGQYQSILTKDYHRLEKSITYENFKPLSSLQVITEIFDLLDKKSSSFGLGTAGNTALNVIEKYLEIHRNLDIEANELKDIAENLNRYYSLRDKSWDKGGKLELVPKDITDKSQIDLSNFFSSRYSIRHFSNKPVEVEKIKQAILLARKTPSVCNRQGWKAHLITDKKQIQKILALQGGSRGFAEEVDKLIIVTSLLDVYHEIKERYQNWIDGGLFSMSLIYSLHSLGLATCGLNWAVKPGKDTKLRKLVPMKKWETPIMMIGIGNYPESFKVCESHRKNIDEILEVH